MDPFWAPIRVNQVSDDKYAVFLTPSSLGNINVMIQKILLLQQILRKQLVMLELTKKLTGHFI